MGTESDVATPTCEDLFFDEPIHRSIDDSWRHGVYVSEVYRRGDGSYWMASFETTPDGETHGLRDGTATIARVRPVEKTVISYVPWVADAKE